MKKARHTVKLNTVKRLMALGIAFVMFFTGAPSKIMRDLIPEKVEASSISETIITGFVNENMGSCAHADSLTKEVVEDAVKRAHVDGTSWSGVKMADVMRMIADGNTELSKTVIDATYDQVTNAGQPDETHTIVPVYYNKTTQKWNENKDFSGTEHDDGEVVKTNPWTTASSQSSGSPYSPGKDYYGNPMNANYTLGNLLVDYVRNSSPGAGSITDEQIISTYDNLSSGENGTPFPDEDAFMSAIGNLVSAAGIHPIADTATISALNRSRYVTYSQYISKRTTPIPSGMLFIGTWLIDAKALNGTFYRMAMESMMADDQQIMLYKSELSSSSWKDIYGATGLESILPLADSVKETDMLDYYVGVVIEKDGIPRWAKTGQVVDVFSIIDPYDLDNLPELKALKMLYDSDLLSENEEKKSSTYIKQRLRRFFNCDTPFARSSTMERDAKYVVEVGGRTGIAFYAPDYRYTYSYTAWAERGYGVLWWWEDLISHGPDMGITDTMGFHSWRFEESGMGFLESIEYLAERGIRRNFDFYYPSNGSTFKPNGYVDQESKLIRGGPSWANEKAWVNEVNAFGGINALRQRIWNYQTLWNHYSSCHDEITDGADKQMDSLKNIYFQLRATGTDEDAELADEAMLIQESVDAVRRAEVYYNLSENQTHNYVIGPVLNFLYLQCATGETPIGGCYRGNYYTDYEDFSDNTTISDAISDAMVECSKSYITYQGRQLENGGTILSQARYLLSNDVIEKAPYGPSAVRADLRQLVDLTNIEQGVIGHKSRELNLLNTLLTTGDTKFQVLLHSSSSDEYRAADADPATPMSTKDEILKDQKADVSAAAGELQRFIKNRAMRLPTDEAVEFVLGRIDWAENQRSGITTDAFGNYAEEALNEHIRWLRDLISAIKEGGDLEDETTNLAKKKIELELQLLTALDENNLEKAEDITNQIKKVDEDIRKNSEAAHGTENQGTGEASDVDLGNLYGVEDTAGKIADNALDKIAEGDYSEIPDALDALEALGSPRIREIADALKTHGASDALINKAEAAAENAEKNTDMVDTDEDTDSGNGGAGLGASDFDSALGLNGDGDDDLSDADLAAALGALTDFNTARNGGRDNAYLDNLLQKLIDEHNPFLYRQYVSDTEEEYVSLAAVDICSRSTKFRMVDSGSQLQASMASIDSGSSASYTFNLGGTEVVPNVGDKITMDKPCMTQEDPYVRGNSTAKYPYITEKYAEKYLRVGCRYIPGTEWAVLVTPQVDRKIAAYLDSLDELEVSPEE